MILAQALRKQGQPTSNFLPWERFLLLQNARRATVSCFYNENRQNEQSTDLNACLILEILSAGIPHASVDYHGGGGIHRFLISCQGLRYEVSFIERLLEACNAEDITHALRIVVDRIQTRTAPRRMKFGAMAGHSAEAV